MSRSTADKSFLLDQAPDNEETSPMQWKFDQAPNVACITSQAVLDGRPVLTATHYSDDHSWAFLDGGEGDESTTRVVSMASILQRHPDLDGIADLAPGSTATRQGPGMPWHRAPHG